MGGVAVKMNSGFFQLDIFNFGVEQRKEELKNCVKVNPAQLEVGDIVEFISYGGNLLEGCFVTKGFWDGRDKESPQYYYFDVDGKFYGINPSVCDWRVVGHDDSYEKPCLYDITERLIDLFKDTAFPKTA